MSELRRAMVLPLALWQENPPIHNITAIIFLEKNCSIATASDHGHIIIWLYDNETGDLIPSHYLIGHHCKIVNFALAGSTKNTDLEYFVSFTRENELALWEVQSGRNVEFLSNLPYDIHYIYSHESQNTKQRLLLCCTKSPEIVVLNSMSLSPICSLLFSSCPNMFVSVTSFNMPTKDDVVIACTSSGIIVMWYTSFSEFTNKSECDAIVVTDLSSPLNMSDPIKVVHNPVSGSIVMVLASYRMNILDTKDWSVLSYQDCPRNDHFVDGHFINHNTVYIHCRSGKDYSFILPERANPRSAIFRTTSSVMYEDIPSLHEIVIQVPERPLPNSKISVCIHKSNEFTRIWKGFYDGGITKIELNETHESSHLQKFNLSETWKKIDKKPAYLTKVLKTDSKPGYVTSLLFISEHSLLVLGMHNGSIYITSFDYVLRGVFMEDYPSTTDFLHLTGHQAAVRCLLHPASSLKLPTKLTATNIQSESCLHLLKLTHILWSGSDDFTIQVWNIKSGQRLNVFHCHSDSIVSLKLNNLPPTSANILGTSQGLLWNMLGVIPEEDEKASEIKQIINRCMNTFIIGVSETAGVSVISMIKRKVVLYAREYDSPVQSLGWMLQSGYLVIETISDTIYVWDLSSGTLERCETGKIANAVMENCPVITKIRSKYNRKILSPHYKVQRHSLNNPLLSDSLISIKSNKVIRFQFITTGSLEYNVPVMIFDVPLLLDSLDYETFLLAPVFNGLNSLNGVISQKNHYKHPKNVSDFDTFLTTKKCDDFVGDFKVLLIKMLLCKVKLVTTKSTINADIYNHIDLQMDKVMCSFGHVSPKTGCVSFNLKSLFRDSTEPLYSDVRNILIQLAISEKMAATKQSDYLEYFSHLESCSSVAKKVGRILSVPNRSQIKAKGSNYLHGLFSAHSKLIFKHTIPQLITASIENNFFSHMEEICNQLILGILDISDTISDSALNFFCALIANLTGAQIQTYILVWRIFLFPDLDPYTPEGGQAFNINVQLLLDKFVDQSYMASDWMWWYTHHQIVSENDEINLTKMQIKSLLTMSLIGAHLYSDDLTKSIDNKKLFSKIFSLDNDFLPRLICDFLTTIIAKNIVKGQKRRTLFCKLINFAIICLSRGFAVWEPFLDSNNLICRLLELTTDLDEMNDDSNEAYISASAVTALRLIAVNRPVVFITVCYRNMLLNQISTSPNSSTSHHMTNQHSALKRRGSTPALGFHSSSDTEHSKCHKNRLHKCVVEPILMELAGRYQSSIMVCLPEVVELHVFLNTMASTKIVDVESLLYPFLRIPSVCINTSSGHIGVGSSKGILTLIDVKIGNYFTVTAHKRAINFMAFSEDAKFVASYSIEEKVLKIWHISTGGMFHLSGSVYTVKLVSSHGIPSIDQLLENSFRNNDCDVVTNSNDYSDINLKWHSDNKTISINRRNVILTKIRI